MSFETSAMLELQQHPGWKLVVERLKKRREDAIFALVSESELNKILGMQARVREIDYLLSFPHDLLQQAQRKEVKEENS